MSLDDLFVVLRSRPGMIAPDYSPISANHFVNGYLLAKKEAGLLSGSEVQFNEKFSGWVKDNYNCQLSKSWGEIIAFFEGENKQAIEKLVDLYEEFNCT